MNIKPVKTAIVGCGAISDIYFKNMIERYDSLDVVACTSRGMDSAFKQAKKYGIKACTFDEILSNVDIELLVILTPAPTHYELIKIALSVGKNVYTEKPIATTVAEAKELIRMADEKGLCLGSAPETFMGSAIQTAKKALDDKLIGDVTSFHVIANRDITVLASMFKFLRMPYGGIAYDYGVYYITALISLLGSINEVFAKVDNRYKKRVNQIPDSPEFGQEYEYNNETQVNAVLTTNSGITGTLSLNGDSALMDLADFTIHGTKGVLKLPDPNQFGGDVIYIPNEPNMFFDGKKEIILEPISSINDNARGIGPAQMAYSIRTGEPVQASKELAVHTLDIVESIIKSGQLGQIVKIS